MGKYNLLFTLAWFASGLILHWNNPPMMIGCFIMAELMYQRTLKEAK